MTADALETMVSCIGCQVKFQTSAAKHIGEEVICPKCGFKHVTDKGRTDETAKSWFLNIPRREKS
jgi:rRNA maturation endonuclease Nob1